MNNLDKILNKENRAVLLAKYRLICTQEVQHLLNSEIKGILLKYYTNTKNFNKYKEMNNRSKYYISKLKMGISEEGYII